MALGAIHDLVRGLARALKESPELRSFQAAKQRVKADRKAEKLIAEFRQQQFRLAALQAQGQKPGPDDLKALEAMAKQLQATPVIHDYFKAEAQFGQLWSDVQRLLCEAVGVEVPREK